MIDALDLADLSQDVADCILHAQISCSVNLVVPPAFDDQHVCTVLVEALAARAGNQPIAQLTMDSIPNADTFVRRLAEGMGVPPPEPGDPSGALERLLRHRDQPALYVLQKFHRTLDALPPWLLAGLRNAEHAGRARALVVSHASHPRLKRRWIAKGHPLVVSDYGDTHVLRVVRLRDRESIELELRDSVPPDILEFTLDLTGSYPEVLRSTLLQSRGHERLTRELRAKLARHAALATQRFIDWLEDREGETHYHRCIIDLHHVPSRDDARVALRLHELNDLILGRDNQLRARGLVLGALEQEHEMLMRAPDARRVFQRAWESYSLANYEHAILLLASSHKANLDAHLLFRHAQIMGMLADVDPRLACDWRRLVGSITETAAWVRAQRHIDETGELQLRYEGLVEIVRELDQEQPVQDIVELTTTCDDDAQAPVSLRAALFVAALCICNADSRIDSITSFSHVVGLPQQLFAIWSLRTLGMSRSEYEVLSFHDYVELARRKQQERAGARPESWLRDDDLMVLDQLHSSSQRPIELRALRRRHLSLCKRWFQATFKSTISASADIGSILQVLPLYVADEYLDWSVCARATLGELFEDGCHRDPMPPERADGLRHRETPASPPRAPRALPEPSMTSAVDVAILIALPEEFRTLAADYAKNWHHQPSQQHPGNDFFFTGPGGYRCVAAISPGMGPTIANHVANALLAHHPAVLVNVGIAGGFTDDMRIADVIVPPQVDAYDENGKISGKEGRWQRRNVAYRPTTTLVAQVRELEFTANDAFTVWTDASREELAALAAGPHGEAIAGLIDAKLLRRKPIISTRSMLASGSFVVASKSFAEFLRLANADVHAGEMEAAGMLAAAEYQPKTVPTLVLRGISDHVDADKLTVDAIGEGALRRLAMANAWRLLSTLMELGQLPRNQAGAATETPEAPST